MKIFHIEFKSWLNNNIVWPINDRIALVLFYLGFTPKCTSFIDGENFSYGYGKMNGRIGIWQFQLPFGFIEKRIKNKNGKTGS